MALNPDPVLLNTGDFETRMAYAQELATQIPAQTMTLSSILIAAYLIIQLILIIVRAQSFGKLVAGIRTVDTKTLENQIFQAICLACCRAIFYLSVGKCSANRH